MANNNYVSGMDSPYGNFQPNGFLAGMMFPDRMQDYRTRRDLQNTGLDTANQIALEQLGTYRADDPVRGAQRQKTLGDLAFGEQMRPTEQSITRQTRLADLERLPEELQTKFIEAMIKKSGANFSKNSQELMQLQSIISPFGDITDENYDTAVSLAERAGMDLTRYWDYADEFSPDDTGNVTETDQGPQVDVVARKKKTKKELMAELNFIRRLNPEVFKFDNDMTKETYTQNQHTLRAREQNASAERIAGMQRDSNRENSAANNRPFNLTVEGRAAWYRTPGGQRYLPQGMTPEQQAALDVFQFQTGARTQMAGELKGKQAANTIASLDPSGERLPDYSVSPNIATPPGDLGPQQAPIRVGADATINGKKYKVIRIEPDGSPVINMNGKEVKIRPRGKQ